MNTAYWIRIAEALQRETDVLYKKGWAHGLTAAEFRRLHRLSYLQGPVRYRVKRDPQWRAIRRALAL